MKKLMMTIVALLVMSTAAMAQTDNNSVNHQRTFERISSCLELSINQHEKMGTVMAQLGLAMKSLEQMKDDSLKPVAFAKIKARHMAQVQEILTKKQMEKYVMLFDNTVYNASDRQQAKDK